MMFLQILLSDIVKVATDIKRIISGSFDKHLKYGDILNYLVLATRNDTILILRYN